MSTMGKLLSRHLKGISTGSVEWIGIRPNHKQEMEVIGQTLAIQHKGLEGDHRCQKTPNSGRQVTLINQEHISVLQSLLNTQEIMPELLRRNIVVSGINLLALRHQQFKIGEAIFEGTSQCHPCVRMEQNLRPGTVAAMLGHGGICAKIIEGGQIKLGDKVELIEKERKSL